MSYSIAILGAGIFATEAYIPALKALGSTAFPVKAVYSRSQSSAQHLADVVVHELETEPTVYHDADQNSNLDVLLSRSDITAVIVVLPITLQPDIVLKALAAGKHVLSEKPVAPDVQQGIDLIQTYRSKYKTQGLIWRVAEDQEAESVTQTAKALIKEGKIGKVQFFKASVVNYIDQDSKWYKTPWRTVPDYQGGFLLDGGVHTAAALRTLLPEPLTHLSGFSSLNKDYLKPHDTIQAVAKASDHFHGLIEMTWASPTKTRPQSDKIIVSGSDGWLSINNGNIRIVRIEKQGEKPAKETEETIDLELKGVQAELVSFFDAVHGKDGVEPLGDPFGALRDVALIQAALNSDGHLVDLDALLGLN